MKSQILQVSVPIFVVLASIVPALPQKSIPDLVEEIKPSVVTIITFDADGEMLGQGSGFFAGHYVFAENDQEPESESNSIPLIISNRHVFEGAYSAEVTMFDGVSFPVWMIDAEYKELDLILVVPMILQQSSLKGFLEYLGQTMGRRMPALEEAKESLKRNGWIIRDVKTLKWVNTPPRVGERILAIGTPLGMESTVSGGMVSAIRDEPGLGKILQITAPISPGSSGGPVVDLEGSVVGIATFQLTDGQNLNFAIHAKGFMQLEKHRFDPLKTLSEWTDQAILSAYKRGREEYDKDNYWAAIEAFEESLALRETSEAYASLGVIHTALKLVEEAISDYRQAILIDPNHALAHYGIGTLATRTGGFGGRRTALEEYRILKDLGEDDMANSLWDLIYK